MKKNINYIVLVISILLVVSCKEKSNYSKIDAPQTASKTTVHKIVVDEFVGGGTYAYLNVTENNESYWMAIPNTDVEKGGTYYYNGGMMMKDFKSEQLNRIFDEIVFVEGIRTSEELMAMPQNDGHTHTQNAVVDAVEEVVKIEKAANGIHLNELLSNKKSFEGKEVILKGKVIKVNNGIMEKNWVHIVDGTQFEDKKSITVTTQEIIEVGDIVTFKGKVTLEKDFGYGYVYDILLEEGELVK
jgi:predicted RNA-binding protein